MELDFRNDLPSSCAFALRCVYVPGIVLQEMEMGWRNMEDVGGRGKLIVAFIDLVAADSI